MVAGSFLEHFQILRKVYNTLQPTVQKGKVFHLRFFQEMWPNPNKLQIWSHLLRKSLMENFIFSAVRKFIRLMSKDCLVAWILLTGVMFVSNFLRKLQISKHYVDKLYWSFIAMTLKDAARLAMDAAHVSFFLCLNYIFCVKGISKNSKTK